MSLYRRSFYDVRKKCISRGSAQTQLKTDITVRCTLYSGLFDTYYKDCGALPLPP
ncbi:MAG TPA: hypothetical protein PKN48_02300 [Bacteroidales bacterium]|nr:hypothetical protein [Bacteroidales bacterium]